MRLDREEQLRRMSELGARSSQPQCIPRCTYMYTHTWLYTCAYVPREDGGTKDTVAKLVVSGLSDYLLTQAVPKGELQLQCPL